jgi:AraC-like DNA-binding protein
MRPNNEAPTEPLRFRVHFAFENLFYTYLGLGCLYVSVPGMKTWKLVIPPRNATQPWWFEHYYGKLAERDRIQTESFFRVAHEKKAHASCVGGLWDVYAPVLERGRVVGALISGSYARANLQAPEIHSRWKVLTGNEGSDQNPDFLQFARILLEAPVFDERTEEAFRHVMEMMGCWVGGEANPRFIHLLERYHQEVFAAVLPHPGWVRWILGIDKFDRQRIERNYIDPWVRKEMGLTRIPTVVASLMPRPDGVKMGAVETMCRNKVFQRECFLAARRVPESVATTLGDYGSLVLTSAKPGLSHPQAKLEVRERLRHLAEMLEKKIGVQVIVGIGTFSPGGENLGRSRREAVTALHLALVKGREPVFLDSVEPEREAPLHEELRASMRALADAFERGSNPKMSASKELFVRRVMVASLGHLESMRTYLSMALQMLLTSFEQKSGVGLSEGRAIGDRWTGRLMETTSTPELVETFRSAVANLAHYQVNPHEAGASARVEAILLEMKETPGKPWHVRKICRGIRMSPPTFLKWFQKSAGMAFGPYLRRLRLMKARELLTEGDLALERVAQECGYSSASAFISFFRRETGMTPREFRDQPTQRHLYS